MHSSSDDHLTTIIRILTYLKKALGKGLISKQLGHFDVNSYTNADWVDNITDKRPTSGYFTSIGGNLVIWCSKKQNVMALFVA